MKLTKSFYSSFRAKVTLALIVSLLFIATLSNFFIYKYTLDSQFDQLREKLMIIAQTAALSINTDLLLEIPLDREGTKTQPYRVIANKLLKIRKANKLIKYIYIMAKTDVKGTWQFVVDPVQPAEEDMKKGLTSFPGEKYNASRFPEMLKAFDGASADQQFETDEWGKTLSGYAPIRNAKGKAIAMLGVDVIVDDFYELQKETHIRGIFVLVLGIILSVLLGTLVSGRITKPIEELARGTQRIAEEDLDYRVEVKGQDEISELSRSFNSMAESLRESKNKLHGYFYRTVQTLVRALEAKDVYTRGHSDRVAEYTEKIAIKMKFSSEKTESLKRIALLHDIGKLGIRANVLNKKGKLTEEEWKMIQEHPIIGENVLTPVVLDKEILTIVRSHHERYDGKGYPDRIKGDDITLLTQIVSVADSYDAMTTARAYRQALSKEEAVKELKEGSGGQFNPEVVEVFVEVLEEEDVTG